MKSTGKTALFITALLLVLCLPGLCTVLKAEASSKPGKPSFTVSTNKKGTKVTVTISKTDNAQGYRIYIKKPGDEKFEKLTTIKLDGTSDRSYTTKKLSAGTYSFKVRAYSKSGSKTVWGKYSKVKTITLKKTDSAKKSIVGVYRCEGYMVAIAENVPEVNNYGSGGFGVITEMIQPYGVLTVSPPYQEGFFSGNIEKKSDDLITAFTTRGDGEHVVDTEYRLDGDTLYYKRVINEDGYTETAVLERTDEDPEVLYLTTAGVITE